MQTADRLQQLKPSYIREILAAATQPDVISLAGGLPSDEHFPLSIFAREFARLTQHPELFQYGSTQGYPALLHHLQARWQLPENHQCLITSGSQQGLDLIARAFFNPGDTLVMEAPSYLGALQVFQIAGVNIVTVPQGAEGPELNALQQVFAEQSPKAFYAVPDFHNPTGLCWSLETRRQVANLCREFQITLIEDAPYRELRFSGTELPMVSSFCPDNALVLRSFSKIAAPGLRLGVVHGPTEWINALIKLKQAADLHTALPLQAAMLGFLKDPSFEEHLQLLRGIYGERHQALAAALQTHLPVVELAPIEGGMFIWLELPSQGDDFELANRCLANKLAVVPGSVFYPEKTAGKAALRLNFSNAKKEQLEAGAKILAEVLQNG